MRTPLIRFIDRFKLASLVLPVLLVRMTVTTEYVNQNFWQPANGPYGGYVTRLAVHPNNGEVFAGLGGGGVFRSTNNGQSWTPDNKDLTNREVRAFAINKSNGNVFAGTAGGVFCVPNNGDTWIPCNSGLTNANVRALAINESNNNIFAGTAGGIFSSANNGARWDSVNCGLTNRAARDVRALVIKSNGDIFSGTADGVYYLKNNSACWDSINTGLSTQESRNIRGLVVQSNGDILAGTANGVFRLRENSEAWVFTSGGMLDKAARDIRVLAIKTNGDVFAGTGAGVYRLRNNSKLWTKVTDLPDNNIFSLAIKEDQYLFAGTLCGVFLSLNSGGSWEEVNNGLTGFDVSALAVNSKDEVFAGTRALSGCGTVGAVVFRSNDGLGSWRKVKNGLPGRDINALAINKLNENMFAATGAGVYRSTDNGASWRPDTIGLTNRNISTVAINSQGEVFAGTNNGGVFRLKNNSSRWDMVNTGLPSYQSGENKFFVSIPSLAVNLNDDIFAGTGVGVFHLKNNSVTWTKLGNGLPDTSSISSLAVNFQGHIFAGVSPNFHRKIAGGIFRSMNDGASWDSVNTGLTNRNIRAFAINSSGVIFAGTNGGVFYSTDNGDHWTEANGGLTSLHVLSLAINSRNIVYAGTTAGGVFRSAAPIISRTVRVVNTNAAPGSMVSVPIELAAQGDENALGFSLNFDPAILSNPQVKLGKDASSASLNPNDREIASGRYGIALALPAGQTFAAGNREIVIVSFTVNANSSASSTRIEFGDQPIAREVVDPKGNVLSAAWTGGPITITLGFESDVTPRPNGNGSVTISDWVQVGRFVAGLDALRTDVNEFQRADCAPKPCGDGRISIADWVQAGRYAAGLDPVVAVCGPASATTAIAAESNTMMKTNANRTIQLLNPKFQSGQMHAIIIELNAQGDENAVGFSVGFDPAVLTFKNVTLGRDANVATLNVNDGKAATGLVGMALALPTGQAFTAGVRQLVLVNFSVNPNTPATSTPIEFKDQPIAREAVDGNGNVLQTSWSSLITSVQEVVNELPTAFELGANAPNPFNPSTTIKYALPQAVEVNLQIFDTLGRHVRTLVDQRQQAGRYAVTWDGRNEQGEAIASGVFIYQLRAGTFVQTRRMALIR